MEIRPVGAELFHAETRTERRTDGRTDVTKVTVAFRNFANAPKHWTKDCQHTAQQWYQTTGVRFHAGSTQTSPKRPDRLIRPPSHLFNGHRGVPLWSKADGA